MKSKILLLILLLIDLEVCGQSYLLEKYQSAYFINGLVGQEKGALYTQGAAGFSVDGRLDLSLRGSYMGENRFASFYTLSPSVSYLVVKQNRIPFSYGISADYEYKRFPDVKILRHSTVKFGNAFYHKVRINRSTSIIPSIYGQLNLTRYSLDSNTENNRSYTVGGQSTVLFRKVAITPGLSYNQQRGYLLSLQLGLIFFKRESIQSIYQP